MGLEEIVNVGLIGLGTVGSGVAKILFSEHGRIQAATGLDIRVRRIAVKDINKLRPDFVDSSVLTNDAYAVINDPDISIVVELTSGNKDLAAQYIMDALKAGKHVVTAGKAPLSTYWERIFRLASENKRLVLFEGSVGGVIPVISLLEYLSSNEVNEITGIVNGTTNYILTRMAEGMGYEEALALAQRKGYAEVPPDLDVLGIDAAQKIAILASVAFRTWVNPEAVYAEGITGITQTDFKFATDRGYAIKLLASARKLDGGIDVRVYPALTKDDVLSHVKEATNAIKVVGSYSGPITLVGKGAGDLPTGTAVVADITDIIKLAASVERGNLLYLPAGADVQVNKGDFSSEGYFRLMLRDVPLALAEVATVIGECRINIKGSAQYPELKDRATNTMPWFFTTYPASQRQIVDALKGLEKTDAIAGKPFYMRVVE